MSIQPIDLQTLFMRLNQVGKEQAVQKEAAHLAQTIQGSEIAKRAEEQARVVNQAKELEDGLTAIDEEEQKNKHQDEEEKKREQEAQEMQRKKFFRDPDLGNKIDISG